MNDEILNPNCSELVCRISVENIKELAKQKIYIFPIPDKDYEDKDVKIMKIIDVENPHVNFDPDSSAKMRLTYAQFDDMEYQLYITASQHCNELLFPTIDRIEYTTGIDFHANDGGSLTDYEDWDGHIYKDKMKSKNKDYFNNYVAQAKITYSLPDKLLDNFIEKEIILPLKKEAIGNE